MFEEKYSGHVSGEKREPSRNVGLFRNHLMQGKSINLSPVLHESLN